MRILLVTDPSSPNGEDAFCREIAKRAKDRGHETTILSVPKGPLDKTVEHLSATGFAKTADAVLINSLQPGPFLAARNAGKKTAVRLIDTYDTAAEDEAKKARELAQQADLIFVPSQHMADIINDWKEDVTVRFVPYAYDRIMAKQIKVVTMRASRKGFSMIVVSRFDEASRAGLDTLFQALARLRLECHLTLVGDGPIRESMMDRTKELVMIDKVGFVDSMEHSKIMEFFRASKAYIDPCGNDGFPMLTLHALSEGCPVIAVRKGALKELIQDGKNGILFSPGDVQGLSEAIMTLWSVRGLSLQLISEGIKTVQRHTWDATANATLEALEAL